MSSLIATESRTANCPRSVLACKGTAFTTLLLAGTMALGLVACGKSQRDGNQPTSTAPQTQVADVHSDQPPAPPTTSSSETFIAQSESSISRPKVKYIRSSDYDERHADWQYMGSLDQMRGDVNLSAGIPSAPAKGHSATLLISPTKGDPTVGLGINGLDLECPEKSCRGAIRVGDDAVESIDIVRSGKGTGLIAQFDFIPRLSTTKSVYLELPIKDLGMVQFHFTPVHPLIWPLPAAG